MSIYPKIRYIDNVPKAIVDLAVIIPTLNEEHFIGYLLDSIGNQNVQPKQIVVVDVYSKDKTINQIKKRKKLLPQLKFFQIPKSTISRQRNYGVSKTSSNHLLFLDADVELRRKDTLKEYFHQIQKKNADLIIATNKSTTNYWKDRLFFKCMDLLFKLSKPIWPMATAINMYIKREVYEKIGGFDENVAVGEDFELVNRLIKNKRKFAIISSPNIYASPRRLQREGRINFILKSARSFFQVIRYGFKNNPVEYQFGHFTLVDQPRKR